MQSELQYTVTTEHGLNELLSGNEFGASVPWPTNQLPPTIPIGATAVIWKRRRVGKLIQPLAVVAHEDDFKRLCGRFAQLRSDLSPISAWCHLISFRQFEAIRSITVESALAGWEAAWTGLSVAEAQLSSGKPLREVSFAACTESETFALARTRSLWGDLDENEISQRFESANRLVKKKNGHERIDPRIAKIKLALKPIWLSLSAALRGGTRVHDRNLTPLVDSLLALDNVRRQGEKNEVEIFIRSLLPIVPEAEALLSLPRLAPEHRLAIFDQLVAHQRSNPVEESSIRHQCLALVAGYLTTVAAGGTPTLTLAEGLANSWPEITAWAYVIGGIGQQVTWTSAFEGLARLVARELMRPFTLNEPPTSDFSVDEATVLVDLALPDPLVHLRIKKSTSITVSLFPGVNIPLQLYGAAKPEIRRQQVAEPVRQFEVSRSNRDLAVLLADLVWPILRPRVEHSIRFVENAPYDPPYKRRNKTRATPELPLKKIKD